MSSDDPENRDGVIMTLNGLAERAEEDPESAARLPATLVRAARRFVVATGVHGVPDEQVAVVPIDVMAVGQLVVQLIREGETVHSRTVQARLAETGRTVPMGTITASLHRAGSRGFLDHVGPGRYRRPFRSCRCTCGCTICDGEGDSGDG